ncbi:antiviral reverse transcriptase Drt3a [Paenarthrobacter sp. NPDC018779]|uniref:antiviral reverse transcriptase Drt3a n=1 Tax=Paenarthrobacter sp. NPDC018779 TaxID=3364375 RepID=UPI0037C7A6C0
MLDQSFSSENFRRIWDLRIRRGEDLARYFPAVASSIADLEDARRSLRMSVSGTGGVRSRGANELVDQYELAKVKRDDVLRDQLSMIALEVNNRIDKGNFNVGFKPSKVVRGKQTYRIDRRDPASYFICRQVEQNLKSAFHLKPPNRGLVAEQLFLALNDRTQKFVMRTDIKAFFESIPHDQLRQLLRRTPGLSRTTSRFVDALLLEHETWTGSPIGLPRGLGISTALAEAFLSQLDDVLSNQQGVTFYARYVDDIVLVFAAGHHHGPGDARKLVVRGCIKSIGLSLNAGKTQYLLLPAASAAKRKRLSYLGYEFDVSAFPVSVDISANRAKRYRERIESSFAAHGGVKGDASADRILIDRMRFLAGNTRLSNNKRQALVGIYFSNSLLSTPSSRILALDVCYKKVLASAALPPSLHAEMSAISFAEGFKHRKYSVFSPKRLQQIVRVWKYSDET